ncbi:MAG: RlmE family RNA methyltransferase [Devosia sp.]|uniref:RlmE family RNA methyltransferase n=1 Tax=Devosia sp. 66-22 TaxID=1895753 RepID=UPI00092AFF24|nr:RlmE family RNA methyltransferase [Devosia sp. 66-22]MBN9346865.1 RlmE family RNA methyltransferase [Devosia sp.]OJX51549.1 MAG: 23S rRNA methyltransferase [Devosia sp. 66-22]
MAKTTNMGGGTGRRSDRDLKVRVKTSKGRKIGSTLWLQRQLNDPYVAQAKAQGLRSRAAYKLIELNERYNLLHKGMRVVDLGAAPGGWSLVAAPIVGTTADNPLIVGIDYLDMDPIEGVVLLKKDFNDPDAPDALIAALGGHKPDLVMSDMAAPTTGHRATDHLRIMQLVELAADFAVQVLAPGGAFIAKVFQGGTEHELLHLLKRHFTTTLHAKPPASRKESAESYLVAKGFKG